MFDVRQFEKVNPQYFNIIMLSEHDVTVQSRNTGHYWYLHNTDYPKEGNCVIFHKHKATSISSAWESRNIATGGTEY